MARKSVSLSNNPLFGGPSLQDRDMGGSPYRELAISDIDVDPDQPRRLFNDDALAELATSIKEHGVLCPILVKVAEGGTFRLVAGERRFRAAKIVGLERIPAIIDSGTDDNKILAKQLVENLQREDLSPMERAIAIGQLKDQYSWSIREIATRLGVSKSFVQRSIEILGLPEDLQSALISGASESKILLLAKVSNKEAREALLSQIGELTRSQIEELIKEIDSGSSVSEVSHGGTVSQQPVKASTEDKRIMETIQRAIGTKVKLTRSKSNFEKGKLILDFYSSEDLNEIYKRLT